MITSALPPFPRNIRQRLLFFLLSVPLRLKIMGMVVGLTIIFGTITSIMVRHILLENMDKVLRQESRTIAQEFSYQSPDYILINDIYGLNQRVLNAVASRQELRYVVILDREHHIITHSFKHGFPVELLRHIKNITPSQNSTQTIPTNEGRIWETTSPIMQGQQGFVMVGVSGNDMAHDIHNFISSLLASTTLVGFAGINLAAILTMLIMRPIKGLLAATKAVHHGHYTIPLPITANDEVGSLTKAFAEMRTELKKAAKLRQEKEILRRNFLHSVMAGQEKERKRLARELHDQLGQSLTSLQVELTLLEKNNTNNQIQGNIDRLRQTISREMEAIHHMAVELRPSILDDMGLIAAIEMYVADFAKRYDIKVDLAVMGDKEELSPCIDSCFYRIAQELLTNALRHGKAKEIMVLLRCHKQRIRLIVEDDGVGFNPHILTTTSRLGIHGIKERLDLVNGTFRLESEPGQGTIVIIDAPIDPGECHE